MLSWLQTCSGVNSKLLKKTSARKWKQEYNDEQGKKRRKLWSPRSVPQVQQLPPQKTPNPRSCEIFLLWPKSGKIFSRFNRCFHELIEIVQAWTSSYTGRPREVRVWAGLSGPSRPLPDLSRQDRVEPETEILWGEVRGPGCRHPKDEGRGKLGVLEGGGISTFFLISEW